MGGARLDWFWNFMLSFFSPRIVAKYVLPCFFLSRFVRARSGQSQRVSVDRIGPLIMLVFFGMLVVGLFYVYFFIPETKGITLEEVCDDFLLSPFTLFHGLTPPSTGGRVVSVWRSSLALDGMETEREALSSRGTREARLGIRGRGLVSFYRQRASAFVMTFMCVNFNDEFVSRPCFHDNDDEISVDVRVYYNFIDSCT